MNFLIFEQLLLVLVTLVDTMLLSGISEAALGAYSLVDSINQLLTQLFLAIGSGGSIIAAQYLGNRDRKGAENTATQAALMVLAISTLIALPVMLLNGPIIRLLYPGVHPSIHNYAKQYLLLSALSYPLYALYHNGASMLYAQGFSKLSMVTSILMYLARILMNFLFIRVWHMDIQGAGLSTIFSRVLGAALATWFLMDQHKPIHYTRPFRLRFEQGTLKRIFSVALPGGLENIIFLACKLIIGMMIAPLPAMLLDMALILNVGVSVLIVQ